MNKTILSLLGSVLLFIVFPLTTLAEEDDESQTDEALATSQGEMIPYTTEPLLTLPNKFPSKFLYDSGVDIAYPEDGVKGVYVTATTAGNENMDSLIEFIDSTDLNTVVVDVKDDYGNVTMNLNTGDERIDKYTFEMADAESLMEIFEEKQIYPIARIVVFKDTILAKDHPELSFKNPDGSLWSNGNGESFVNPFMKEVWEYNTDVAIAAAKLGFKDIQFDYVRFPEGFETRDTYLSYSQGDYADMDTDNITKRVAAVTDFVAYAKDRLKLYDVEVSVDIFGYTAVVREAPGIGQSFPKIAAEVDVISSMIYPSHWGPGNLDIPIPDLDPYGVVHNYMPFEFEIFEELGEDAPRTRPWLQDFTASYLGAGRYMEYGAQEVTAQVKALADHGIHEFLLWDAANTYSPGATYSFE